MTPRWVTAFLDLPKEHFDLACGFWQAVTGYGASVPRGAVGEFVTLEADRGDPFLRVQRIGGDTAGVHVDLHVEDVAAAVQHAVRLGASPAGIQGGPAVMRSPGGLAFCLVKHHGEKCRPRANPRPGGRSLVDQVCVDIPPGLFNDECRFWAGMTGWELRQGSRPEYMYLARPEGIPVRLLLQRLDDADAECCHGHLDLACDDVEAERARHEMLGGRVALTMPDWTTMVDPAGLTYCLTRRNPDTGKL
ncbi:MAG: VOC family protein [Acidimicrobiales bacterium]